MPGEPQEPSGWLIVATLVWWCLGPVPLACGAVLLTALGFFGSEGLGVGFLGVGCGVLLVTSAWMWFRPRHPRVWVEALRSAFLALPFAFPTWLIAVTLRKHRLAGVLDDLSLAPLEVSVLGGALLCGAILSLLVRLHTPAAPKPQPAE